jgi:hypothetical protein
MPAAFGLTTASAAACSRGDREVGFGGLSALAGLTWDDLALAGERLRWLMVSAPLLVLQRYKSIGVRFWREIRAARLRCW